MVENIDISDIQEEICEDGKKRHLLDSPSKIIRWIKYQFAIQQKNNKDHPERSTQDYIDISDCIICTQLHDNKPAMTNISDLAGEIDCIIKSNTSGCVGANTYHTEVLKRVHCYNSIIYASFFHSTRFHDAFIFTNTQFLGSLNLGGSCFDNSFHLSGCKFKGGSLHCDGAIFKDSVYLGEIEFSIFQISLIRCVFENEVKICHFVFDENRYIDLIKNGSAYMTFYGSTFKSELKLFNIDLIRLFDLSRCVFEGDVSLHNITSEHAITFRGSTAKDNLIISSNSMDTRIAIKELHLSNMIAERRVDIESCEITSLYARFMQVESNALLRICNCCIMTLDMDSLYNNGYVFFDVNKKGIANIRLDSAINNGIIEVEDTDIKNLSSRKTARILKDSAYKSNNPIDATLYRSKEYNLYREELIQKCKSCFEDIPKLYVWDVLKAMCYLLILVPCILIAFCIGMYIYTVLGIVLLAIRWSPIYRWGYAIFRYFTSVISAIMKIPITEYLLLRLSSISNNNGLSWMKGICFTTCIAALFFVAINYIGIENNDYLFKIDGMFENFSDVWKMYLNMFYLTDFKDKFQGISLNAWGETLFFISKIFIGYGIYQTIAAFRKYGR